LQLIVNPSVEGISNFSADNVPRCIGLQTFSRLLSALRNAGRDIATLQKFYQLDTNVCWQRCGAMVTKQVRFEPHADDGDDVMAEVSSLLREGVKILCCESVMRHDCELQQLNKRSKLFENLS
jgi:hypothetical protein